MSAYPLLVHLLGAYLHQDYDLDDPDPLKVLRLGVKEGFLDRLPSLLEEMERLHAELLRLDPGSGQALLRSLGSEINVAASGHTPATWVAEAIDDVRRIQESGSP